MTTRVYRYYRFLPVSEIGTVGKEPFHLAVPNALTAARIKHFGEKGVFSVDIENRLDNPFNVPKYVGDALLSAPHTSCVCASEGIDFGPFEETLIDEAQKRNLLVTKVGECAVDLKTGAWITSRTRHLQ